MDSTELRRIDVAVAEAMGQTVTAPSGLAHDMWISACSPFQLLPHYTTDWSAAGQIVEWIGNQGKFYIEVYNDALGYSLDLIPIQLEDEADFVCGDRAPTGPLAICLAFLQAVGVEVPSE